jgi:hypothetical protein
MTSNHRVTELLRKPESADLVLVRYERCHGGTETWVAASSSVSPWNGTISVQQRDVSRSR